MSKRTLWDRLWRWLDRHARAIQGDDGDEYAPEVTQDLDVLKARVNR